MTYLKLLLTAVFWGGTFIAGKWVSVDVDPYSAAFLRFLIASFFLIFLTLKIEGRLPGISFGKLLIIIVLGFTGIFSYNLFFFLRTTPYSDQPGLFDHCLQSDFHQPLLGCFFQGASKRPEDRRALSFRYRCSHRHIQGESFQNIRIRHWKR